MTAIVVKHVRQHNLRIPELSIPLHTLVGVTGPSGSGKSSLVVHTLFAESQRQYLSSLSTYERQFFERWAKPDVERIENLGAALYVGQKNHIRNARATVATTSGIYPLFANLYAYFGTRVCPQCEATITVYDAAALYQYLAPQPHELWIGFEVAFASPQAWFEEEVAMLVKQGLDQICISEDIAAGRSQIHSLLDPSVMKRMRGQQGIVVMYQGKVGSKEDVEEWHRTVSAWASRLTVVIPNLLQITHLAITDVCGNCGTPYGELLPGHFSYYSSLGACPTCNGFGNIRHIDLDAIVTRLDGEQSLDGGFLAFLQTPRFREYHRRLIAQCHKRGIPVFVPWNQMTPQHRQMVLYGDRGWKGLKGFFDYLERKKYQVAFRIFLHGFYSERMCETCRGTRLSAKAFRVHLEGITLAHLVAQTIADAKKYVDAWCQKYPMPDAITAPIVARLGVLCDLGVGYLHLSRLSRTLSGGEVQRLSLVHHLGTSLSDTLYILDEPSIGLHPRDCHHVVAICRKLVSEGNHIIMVEHDEAVLGQLDHLIALGPGSGNSGGRVVWQGDARQWASQLLPLTIPPRRRQVGKQWLEIQGARGHNLQSVTCRFPLQALVGVCGVSGSGKTTLILHTLVPYLTRYLGHNDAPHPLAVDGVIFPISALADVEYISQELPVRSSRANLLTVTGIMDSVRTLFAALPESKRAHMKPGHFSFNSKLGQCPECEGAGEVVMEMVFMEDIHLVCERCRGLRYHETTLAIRYQGKHIADVLAMTVDEAGDFFQHHTEIRRMLAVLQKVGLGYMTCGQGMHTYSGGELQRLKISRIFMSRPKRPIFYVLDEPTTGLHREEVITLLALFEELVAFGHTVLVIEHHPYVLSRCDYVVELGPGGGQHGGQVIFQGTPDQMRKAPHSVTAPFLV